MADQSPVPFEPAQLRPRHDGWTADRQIRFIEALAATGCVEEACRRVGKSDSSAYALRDHPAGGGFRRAWDAAVDNAMPRLEQAMIGRAMKGVARPVFYKGEQVGEWRHFDERLAMFLLRSRRPARYGKWMDRMLAPDPRLGDEGTMLDYGLAEIERNAPEEHGNLIDDCAPGADEDGADAQGLTR